MREDHKSFTTKLRITGIRDVLIDHLGVWDYVRDTYSYMKEDKYRGYRTYVWHSKNIAFLLSEDKKEHYYIAFGIYGNRRIKRLIDRLELNDKTWILRKLVLGYVDPVRLKRQDVRAYIPFAVAGSLLTLLSFILGVLGFILPFQLTLFSAIGVPLLWGLYRYGVAEGSLDIRFMSLALQMVVVWHSVGVNLVVLFIGSTIPPGLDPLLHSALVIILWIVTYSVFFRIINTQRVIGHLRKKWSEIRTPIEDDERLVGENSVVSDGVRIGRITYLSLASAFGVGQALTLIAPGFLLFQIISDVGLIPVHYYPLFVVIVIAYVIFSIHSAVGLGQVHGLNIVLERVHDFIEVIYDEDGRVGFRLISTVEEMLKMFQQPGHFIIAGNIDKFFERLKKKTQVTKEE